MFGSAALTFTSRIRAEPVDHPGKPNLLVFLPDQQRADTIGCYGGNTAYAPNLCQLAERSFVFEQAYVTQPICTPSRSSLMTGTWPHANGCTRNRTRLEGPYQCLPEMIDDPEYRCAYMGKWHLGDEVFPQHGFAEWVSIMDGYQIHFSPGRDPTTLSDYGNFLISKGFKPDGMAKKQKLGFSNGFSGRLPLELSKPKFLETKACDFLERHRNRPFVLFVSFFEPHPPYNGPLNDEHPYDEIEMDPTAAQVMGDNMPSRYRTMQARARKRFVQTPEAFRKAKQRYLGLVTEMDQSIGAILAKLKQLGLDNNTIVIHTSDHGDMMGAHHMFGKKVMFQEATRVPYLVHMPNQDRNISISQPVSHIDFLPTLLDLLNQRPSKQCAGRSLAPLFRGASIPAGSVFLQWAPEGQHPQTNNKKQSMPPLIAESTRAVITPDGWKLCLRDRDKNELYNLVIDPKEEHNLFYISEHRDVVDRLREEIHVWQAGAGDMLQI